MILFDDEMYYVDRMFDKVSEHACTCVRGKYAVVDEVIISNPTFKA